jgi:predicted small lipoprotein YifL
VNKKIIMKNIIKNISIVAVLILMASCSVSGPLILTDNPGGKDSKKGESSYKVILGFPPFKADASIATAAKNGGIKKVSTVDLKMKAGFFVTTYTTVVTGE